MANTETARRVDALGIGWVVEEPLVDSVSKLLEELTVEEYQAKQGRLKSLPPSTFWEIDDLERICNCLLALRAPDKGVMVSA